MAIQMVSRGLFLLTYMCILIQRRCEAINFQRTILFIRVETSLGENVFLRGGKNASCSMEVAHDACAIPIRHRLTSAVPHTSSFSHWSTGDNFLDWHGAERHQGLYSGVEAGGTPLVWTTSQKGGPVMLDQGYGYTNLNNYGSHFWLMDVDMDCSRTDHDWFEFKAFVTPTRKWESDILQTAACGGASSTKPPYSGSNHMAQCGKFNLFYYENGGCIIDNITTAMSMSEPSKTQQMCGNHPNLSPKIHSLSGKRSATHVTELSRRLDELLDRNSIREKSEDLLGDIIGRAKHVHRMSSTRITHGHPAAMGRWPWMAEILYKGRHGCGASLISPSWAITAGHCVRTATAFGAWGLLLRVGELERQTFSGSERDYFVKRIIKHPLFDKNDGSDVDNDNDIALLEMVYPIEGVSGVTPICLPRATTENQFASAECWGVGWGKTDGNDPNSLQEVKMSVSTSAECSHYYATRVSERQLCAGGGNISACSGDSGSPLSCVKDGRWYVAGVVSWGDDNCHGRPSIYTRISAHLDWIRKTTGLGHISVPVIG